MQTRFSVVMPANNEEEAESAISEVVNDVFARGPAFGLVAVDDGSPFRKAKRQ